MAFTGQELGDWTTVLLFAHIIKNNPRFELYFIDMKVSFERNCSISFLCKSKDSDRVDNIHFFFHSFEVLDWILGQNDIVSASVKKGIAIDLKNVLIQTLWETKEADAFIYLAATGVLFPSPDVHWRAKEHIIPSENMTDYRQ